jgi:hypothetical protein
MPVTYQKQFGDYVVESNTTWGVWLASTETMLSEHASKAGALDAVKCYQMADARRLSRFSIPSATPKE